MDEAHALQNEGGDPNGLSPDQKARQSVMAVLAQASLSELKSAWETWPAQPDVSPVRGPETGLVMIRGRIGGGGAPFNLGEATVTRATVELSTGTIGHAQALGTDKDKVRYAAIIDALWQEQAHQQTVETNIVEPIRQRLESEKKKQGEQAAATQVDFFTMVRGED